MFVAIRTCDNRPRMFMRKYSGICSVCTDDCIFNSVERNEAVKRLLLTPWCRNDWQFYKVPDNYSIIGKTPLEFLIQTQGYKPPALGGLCAKQKRRNDVQKKKKKTSAPIEPNGLF